MVPFQILQRQVVSKSSLLSRRWFNSKIKSCTLSTMARSPRDPSTLSNYEHFKTRHTAAEFNIDFEKRVLNGSVTLDLEATNNGDERNVYLDTSYLDIQDVEIDNRKVQWTVHPRGEPFGSKLEIKLDSAFTSGSHFSVNVRLSDEFRSG